MIKYICDHCGKEAPVGNIYTLTANRPVPMNDLIMAKALSDKHICRDCLLGLWRKPEEEVVVTSKTKRVKLAEIDSETAEKPEKEPKPPVSVSEPDTVAKMLTVEEPPKKRKGGNREGIGEKVPLIEKARMDELTGKKKKRYYLTEADKAVISERYAKGDEMDAIAEDLGVALPPVSVYIAHEGLGEERYKGQAVPDHGGQPVMSVTTGVYKVKGGR